MNLFWCTCLWTIYLVFTCVKCDGQSSCVVPIQQNSLGDHHVILEELVENNNFTIVADLSSVLNNSSNATFTSELEDIGTELLSNTEKGRVCLKNLTKCLDNGKFNIFINYYDISINP